MTAQTREHWLWQSLRYIDFSAEVFDQEAVRIAAATHGGLPVRELAEMSFARYERVIRIVNDMNKPEGEGDAD